MEEADDGMYEFIKRVLQSDVFTDGEKEYVKFQSGMLDGFYVHLWEAIAHADDESLARLEKGFPEEVAVFRTFKKGGLRQPLKAEG